MTANTPKEKSKLPPWVKVTLWGTLAIVLAAILIPAALRTTVAGMRGDFDPQVIEAKEHQEQVELTKAEAQDKIDDLESRIRAQDKILSSTGSPSIPTDEIMAVLPPCALEDGSTQDMCVWDGRVQGNGTGAIVVNLAMGKFSFYPQTNGWVVNE